MPGKTGEMEAVDARRDVGHLLGADARAILSAVSTAIAKTEANSVQLRQLTEQVGKTERASWAALNAVKDAKAGVELLRSELSQVKVNHTELASRVAAELIRLTVEDKTLARQLQDTAARERGSLADVERWEEVTSHTLIKHVLDRAQSDMQFQKEAAQAGLGLRVHTWKTVLSLVVRVVTSLVTAGVIAKVVLSWFGLL